MTPKEPIMNMVSLKDYIDTRFDELDARLKVRYEVVDTKIEGVEKAVKIAHKVLDTRLHAMNNVYAHLKEQSEQKASKETVDYNSKRITLLEQQVAEVHGKTVGNMQLAIIAVATFITAAVTIVHMLWK